MTTFVLVVVGLGVGLGVGLTLEIVALVIPPDNLLCFLNTLAPLSLLNSVPGVSSPLPCLREGNVRLRVTPDVVVGP